MRICSELWDAGISADFMYKVKPKLPKQYDFCDKEENQVPWGILIGGEEVKAGKVRIKDMQNKSEDPELKKGQLVDRSEMIAELKKRLNM